jgi:class 3 adenylate cyclase
MLAEFASVVDAVRCAVDVQRGMALRPTSASTSASALISAVIVDGDDIYGDGVNFAARLESIADAGRHSCLGHRTGRGSIACGSTIAKRFARPQKGIATGIRKRTEHC